MGKIFIVLCMLALLPMNALADEGQQTMTEKCQIDMADGVGQHAVDEAVQPDSCPSDIVFMLIESCTDIVSAMDDFGKEDRRGESCHTKQYYPESRTWEGALFMLGNQEARARDGCYQLNLNSHSCDNHACSYHPKTKGHYKAWIHSGFGRY